MLGNKTKQNEQEKSLECVVFFYILTQKQRDAFQSTELSFCERDLFLYEQPWQEVSSFI